MLFAWIGFMKAGSETVPQDVQHQVSDFLQQPYIPIEAAGPLCDENGRRAAMLMIFDAEDRASAEALVASSPYKRAGLYEHYHLYEFRNEVG
jgi:uncharacterized protein YciI